MRDGAHGFSPEDLKNIDEVITALRDLVRHQCNCR